MKVIDKLRYEFLSKDAKNSSSEKLYEKFDYYYTNCADVLDSDYRRFGDSLYYIKSLLNNYSPKEVAKIYASKIECGLEVFEHEDIEDIYLYFMNLVATIHYFYTDYGVGVYWSKKVLDLVYYFHSNLNMATKEKILDENSRYKEAKKNFEKYKSYFDQETYESIVFNWEKKSYLNDN